MYWLLLLAFLFAASWLSLISCLTACEKALPTTCMPATMSWARCLAILTCKPYDNGYYWTELDRCKSAETGNVILYSLSNGTSPRLFVGLAQAQLGPDEVEVVDLARLGLEVVCFFSFCVWFYKLRRSKSFVAKGYLITFEGIEVAWNRKWVKTCENPDMSSHKTTTLNLKKTERIGRRQTLSADLFLFFKSSARLVLGLILLIEANLPLAGFSLFSCDWPPLWDLARMANRTVKDAQSIKGTNPQYLVEKIIRTRIYDSKYWKEDCFALTGN